MLNSQPGWLAGLKSRFLLPGAIEAGEVTLLTTDKPVKNGLKIGQAFNRSPDSPVHPFFSFIHGFLLAH